MKELPAHPTFMIGHVPVYGDLILAPMAGYSDVPFRTICRRMGSVISYTPCIADNAVLQRSLRTARLADFVPEERPVAIQMLGKDEERLLLACSHLLKLQPDMFDLNMGCPARRVSWGGRGAALLREPDKIGRLVRRLVKALPVPITAKIRLGWDDESRNYLLVARLLEDSGASAIAIHGRTKAQGYGGHADWHAIAQVKEAVSIPVLANGDVRTVSDIRAIKSETGCDGVLIGRAAIGNPWIFARRDIADVPYVERLAMIRHHLATMVSYYGEGVGVILFRKHLIKYVQGLEGAAALRPLLVNCQTQETLLGVLES